MGDDEKKVPPGWVRLTQHGEPDEMLLRVESIDAVDEDESLDDAGERRVLSRVFVRGRHPLHLEESPAEVAALIAEAEAAERRARALPAMAAEICSGALVDTRTLTELAKPGDGSTHADVLAQLAVVMAGRILDAIEARGDDG